MPTPHHRADPIGQPISRSSSHLVRYGVYALCAALLVGMSGCTPAFWRKVFAEPQSAVPAEPYHTKLKRVNLVIERQEDGAKPRAKKRAAHMPVSLRIYPLRQLQAFSTANPANLRDDDKTVLGQDRLGRIDLTLTPGEAVQIPVPMPEGTNFVGVVVFFRDRARAEWQLAVPRSRWDNEDPVTLVINGNRLEMASD